MAARPMKTTITLNRTEELDGGAPAFFDSVALLEGFDSIEPQKVHLAEPQIWREPNGELNIA